MHYSWLISGKIITFVPCKPFRCVKDCSEALLSLLGSFCGGGGGGLWGLGVDVGGGVMARWGLSPLAVELPGDEGRKLRHSSNVGCGRGMPARCTGVRLQLSCVTGILGGMAGGTSPGLGGGSVLPWNSDVGSEVL